MSTLTVLDWPRLLVIPDTRWYLDHEAWDQIGHCTWSAGDCSDPAAAYAEYQVCDPPGDTYPMELTRAGLVCSHHLPDLIAHATGEPLVAGTVVEVGVDPALLRLMGVDSAVVDRFNKHALGVSA